MQALPHLGPVTIYILQGAVAYIGSQILVHSPFKNGRPLNFGLKKTALLTPNWN